MVAAAAAVRCRPRCPSPFPAVETLVAGSTLADAGAGTTQRRPRRGGGGCDPGCACDGSDGWWSAVAWGPTAASPSSAAGGDRETTHGTPFSLGTHAAVTVHGYRATPFPACQCSGDKATWRAHRRSAPMPGPLAPPNLPKVGKPQPLRASTRGGDVEPPPNLCTTAHRGAPTGRSRAQPRRARQYSIWSDEAPQNAQTRT